MAGAINGEGRKWHRLVQGGMELAPSHLEAGVVSFVAEFSISVVKATFVCSKSAAAVTALIPAPAAAAPPARAEAMDAFMAVPATRKPPSSAAAPPFPMPARPLAPMALILRAEAATS